MIKVEIDNFTETLIQRFIRTGSVPKSRQRQESVFQHIVRISGKFSQFIKCPSCGKHLRIEIPSPDSAIKLPLTKFQALYQDPAKVEDRFEELILHLRVKATDPEAKERAWKLEEELHKAKTKRRRKSKQKK